jgi:hypothetical protein
MPNFDTRHGGPYDRGGADYWYNRGYNPHYYIGNTYASDRVTREEMTAEELAAYRAGYCEAEAAGDQKDYG